MQSPPCSTLSGKRLELQESDELRSSDEAEEGVVFQEPFSDEEVLASKRKSSAVKAGQRHYESNLSTIHAHVSGRPHEY